MTRSLASAGTVSTTHTTTVAAPAAAVFRLIAEAEHWPYLFPQVVHVERLSGGPAEDRLRLWTSVNGAVGCWMSRRSLDREGLRIRFRQETPSGPVAAMSGEWIVIPLPGEASSVVLLHEFRTAAGTPGETALVRQAVDRNSTAELAALKTTAELGDALPGLVHSFADSVLIKAPLAGVYDFLHRAARWPEQVPHISRLALDESVQHVQTLEMESIGPDGSPDTIRLLRVCFPAYRIVYKQTAPVPALRAHVGEWRLEVTADGVRATALNTVVVRPRPPAEPSAERPSGRHLHAVPDQYGRSGQIRPAPAPPGHGRLGQAHGPTTGQAHGAAGLRSVPSRPPLHGLPTPPPGTVRPPRPARPGSGAWPGAGAGHLRDPGHRSYSSGPGRRPPEPPAEAMPDPVPDPVVEKVRAALRHHCTAILLHAKDAAEGRAAVR